MVVYQDADATIDDPAFGGAVASTLDSLPASDVTSVTSYWSTGGAPGFVSDDGSTTFATLSLAGSTDAEREESYLAVADSLVVPDVETYRGGQVATFLDINSQIEEDLATRRDALVPDPPAAARHRLRQPRCRQPAARGGWHRDPRAPSRVLNVATQFGDVSVFAINIVTMLGLGLAIDYALFVVSRFREELARGMEVEDAVARTMATAGRTVAISGLTVAVSLGVAPTLPDELPAVDGPRGNRGRRSWLWWPHCTTLPALLAVMGHRVDSLELPWRRGGQRRRLDRWCLGAVGALGHAASGHCHRRHRGVLAVARSSRSSRWPSAASMPAFSPQTPRAGWRRDLLDDEFPSASQPPSTSSCRAWTRADAGQRRPGGRRCVAVTSATVTGPAGDTAVVSLAYRRRVGRGVGPADRDRCASTRR